MVHAAKCLTVDCCDHQTWASKDSTAVEFQINKAYDIEDTGTIVTGLVQRCVRHSSDSSRRL